MGQCGSRTRPGSTERAEERPCKPPSSALMSEMRPRKGGLRRALAETHRQRDEAASERRNRAPPIKEGVDVLWWIRTGVGLWALRLGIGSLGVLTMLATDWSDRGGGVFDRLGRWSDALGVPLSAAKTQTQFFYPETTYAGDSTLYGDTALKAEFIVIRKALPPRSRADTLKLFYNGLQPHLKTDEDEYIMNMEFAPDNRFYYFNRGKFPWEHVEGVGEGQRKGDSSGNSTLKEMDEMHANGTFFYASAEYDPRPGQTSMLDGFVPMYQEISRGASKPFEGSGAQKLRLWTASNGAIATVHYDIQHNFFCQVSGNKTFRLAPPTAHQFLMPYTSSHPRYRQGYMPKIPVVNPSCANSYEEAVTNGCKNANVSIAIQSFQVTLQSGDCMFLPAYMFHEVQSVVDSVSINWWYSSGENTIIGRLDKLGLPFPKDLPDFTAKHVAFAATVHRMLTILSRTGKTQGQRDGSDFLAATLAKYKHLPGIKDGVCPTQRPLLGTTNTKVPIQPFCPHGITMMDLRPRSVKKAATETAQIFGRLARGPRELLLQDYIERVLNMLLEIQPEGYEENASPCRAEEFFRKCLVEPRALVYSWIKE